MNKPAHTKKEKSGKGLKRAGLFLLVLLLLACALFALLHRPARNETPETDAAQTASAAPRVTAAPTATPASTAEPTPTSAPTPTEAPTPAPTETPTAEPTAEAVFVPVEPGEYYYGDPKTGWTLSLRDNGTFTLRDPDGGFHTGEGWSQNDDGTVSCGPTDIYKAPFAFSGGCSKWRITGTSCVPIVIE